MNHQPNVSPPRSWAEISQENFLHNLEVAREISGTSVMAVLKAGAYGHGLKELAIWLDRAEIAFFGVASVMEARKLTKLGVKQPIYLLGPTFPEEREEIVKNRWVASISSLEEAEHFARLNNTGHPLRVHLTIDTGMGRGGFLPEQVVACMESLLAIKEIEIEGVGSHLPSADEDKDFTLRQFEVFEKVVKKLEEMHKFSYVHLSNSAGLLDYKSTVTNLSRPGLMLYGVSPIKEYQKLLKPVMSLKSRVSLVRKLPAGQGVSYGRTYVLEKESMVATVGIGYGDGYSRQLSGKGAEVLIRGERCPVLGRVTMDQIMVDVSHIEGCESGDEVELFGEHILIAELSEKSDLIPWEILTGITPRVLRVHQ